MPIETIKEGRLAGQEVYRSPLGNIKLSLWDKDDNHIETHIGHPMLAAVAAKQFTYLQGADPLEHDEEDSAAMPGRITFEPTDEVPELEWIAEIEIGVVIPAGDVPKVYTTYVWAWIPAGCPRETLQEIATEAFAYDLNNGRHDVGEQILHVFVYNFELHQPETLTHPAEEV